MATDLSVDGNPDIFDCEFETIDAHYDNRCNNTVTIDNVLQYASAVSVCDQWTQAQMTEWFSSRTSSRRVKINSNYHNRNSIDQITKA